MVVLILFIVIKKTSLLYQLMDLISCLTSLINVLNMLEKEILLIKKSNVCFNNI